MREIDKDEIRKPLIKNKMKIIWFRLNATQMEQIYI
jgi:hypothetical protein